MSLLNQYKPQIKITIREKIEVSLELLTRNQRDEFFKKLGFDPRTIKNEDLTQKLKEDSEFAELFARLGYETLGNQIKQLQVGDIIEKFNAETDLNQLTEAEASYLFVVLLTDSSNPKALDSDGRMNNQE